MRKTKAEIRAARLAAIAKAHEAKRLLMGQRELVRRKVEQGLPITEEERQLLHRKFGSESRRDTEAKIEKAAAALTIKPQSVTALRVLVETTAAKHKYNPIEELIKMTKPNEDGTYVIETKDVVSIHKALLPFLVPTMPAPKPGADGSTGEGGVKVVVTQFHFPAEKPTGPLHLERPATVATTSA